MLATATDLKAYLNINPADPKQAQYAALADMMAPVADRLVKKYVGYQVEQAMCYDYHPLISSRPSLSQGFVEDDEFLAYEGSPQGARPIRQGRGNSRDTLSLYNLPVRSITAIYENPAAWLNPLYPTGDWHSNAVFLLKEGRDFQVDWDSNDADGNPISQSGFVFRIGAVWSLQAATVFATYLAGYTPSELQTLQEYKMAALMTGAKLYQEAKLLGRGPGFSNTGIITQESEDDYSVTYAAPLMLPALLMNDLPPSAAKMILEELVRMSKRL